MSINWIKYIYIVKSIKEKNLSNLWIIKPGENSNRGNGISIHKELYEINEKIKSSSNP
jgi:hypothetical protein